MAADQALLLDVEERKKVYTFRYRDLPQNMPAAKAPPPPPPPSGTEVVQADGPLVSPPAKPAAVKRKRSASTVEKKPAAPKKSKFTSVKSLESSGPKKESTGLVSDDPFAFDEPGSSLHFCHYVIKHVLASGFLRNMIITHCSDPLLHIFVTDIGPPPVRMLSPKKRKSTPPSPKKSRSLSTSSSSSAKPPSRKSVSTPRAVKSTVS